MTLDLLGFVCAVAHFSRAYARYLCAMARDLRGKARGLCGGARDLLANLRGGARRGERGY